MMTSEPAQSDLDDEQLVQAVADLLASDQIEVPPIPDVVAQLSAELSSPTCDLRAASRIVGTDQVLTAHILRCASSAQMAMRPVTSLSEAVMRVGTNALFSLTMSFCLARQVTRRTPLESVRRELFRRAAASAEFCRLLAPSRGIDPEISFLCGLLGTWGMMLTLNAIEHVLADQRVRQARPYRFWMQVAYDCDAHYGGLLAQRWGLPPVVSEVLASRGADTPPSPEIAPYAQLLTIADRLTVVFYRDAEPSLEAIAEAAGVSTEQARGIAALMPQVAAAVWSLSAAADEVKRHSGPIRQTMVMPVVDAPSILKGTLVTTKFPVIVEGGGPREKMVCTGLAVDGLLARGDRALPLNQTIKCRLMGPGEEVELFAVVVSSVKEGRGYLTELKPVGLTSMHARKWQDLRSRAVTEGEADDDGDGEISLKDAPAELAPAPLEVEKVRGYRGRTQVIPIADDRRGAAGTGAYMSVHRRGLRPVALILAITAAAAVAALAAFLLI